MRCEQERSARLVLGVGATDGFEAIHQAYEKVIRLVEPSLDSQPEVMRQKWPQRFKAE